MSTMSPKDSELESQIADLRKLAGVSNDAELAAALGVHRSAIAQWKKRGSVPKRALEQIRFRSGARSLAVSREGQIDALPDQLRDFSLALAIVYIAPWTPVSADDVRDVGNRLLDRTAGLTDIQHAASVLLRNCMTMLSVDARGAFDRLLASSFFRQDMAQALVHRDLYRLSQKGPQ